MLEVEVFRAARLQACEERALVLAALNIPYEVRFEFPRYGLFVHEDDVARALEQLQRYELERRPRPPPPPPPPLQPHAWWGSLGYGFIVVFIGVAIANGLLPLDAFQRGELNAAAVQAGQWWRAWTALTLHVDGAHLLANLSIGIWFGVLAGRQLGPGHAWLLTVIGAGFANLFDALLGPINYRSVGASTAVFTCLGLLSAYAWQMRGRWHQSWAARLAPLVGGLVLLGWAGTGGESGADIPGSSGASGPAYGPTYVMQVDIVAHALGFAMGAALGIVVAGDSVSAHLKRVPQWLSGAAAVAVIALAWSWALHARA